MRERTQLFDPRQSMRRADYEIFHYRDQKLSDVEVHHHDFYEIYLFLSGQVEYRVEGQLYHPQVGDLILINPMELHQPILRPGRQPYERMVLWISKPYLDRLDRETDSLVRCFDTSLPTHSNLIHPSPSQRDQLQTLMEALSAERSSNEYGGALCAEGILMQFLVLVNRLALRASQDTARPEETPALISQVLSYINDHYQEELSLELLAQRFYVSKYHLSHTFSKAVGTSVYRYIILKRLMIAKQLLQSGTAPGTAYSSCGFGDYANFYRAFKAQYGISPSECTVEG